MGAQPTRTCLACRRQATQRELVRLATGPVEAAEVARSARVRVLVDPVGRVPGRFRGHLPGRGAYLCHREECLQVALRRDAGPLRRALRVTADVQVDRGQLQTQWREAVATTHHPRQQD